MLVCLRAWRRRDHCASSHEHFLPLWHVIFTLVVAAWDRADELEAAIMTVRGRDEAAAVRALEAALKSLRMAFGEVSRLAEGAVEAAAKCEVSGSTRYMGACVGHGGTGDVRGMRGLGREMGGGRSICWIQ